VSNEFSVRSFPFLCDDPEGSESIGPDEFQRFLIFFVFIAVIPVKILKNVTALKIAAVCAYAIASQLADATYFYLAPGFCNISITCLITRRATWASALGLFPAASAECATTANLMF